MFKAAAVRRLYYPSGLRVVIRVLKGFCEVGLGLVELKKTFFRACIRVALHEGCLNLLRSPG